MSSDFFSDSSLDGPSRIVSSSFAKLSNSSIEDDSSDSSELVGRHPTFHRRASSSHTRCTSTVSRLGKQSDVDRKSESDEVVFQKVVYRPSLSNYEQKTPIAKKRSTAVASVPYDCGIVGSKKPVPVDQGPRERSWWDNYRKVQALRGKDDFQTLKSNSPEYNFLKKMKADLEGFDEYMTGQGHDPNPTMEKFDAQVKKTGRSFTSDKAKLVRDLVDTFANRVSKKKRNSENRQRLYSQRSCARAYNQQQTHYRGSGSASLPAVSPAVQDASKVAAGPRHYVKPTPNRNPYRREPRNHKYEHHHTSPPVNAASLVFGRNDVDGNIVPVDLFPVNRYNDALFRGVVEMARHKHSTDDSMSSYQGKQWYMTAKGILGTPQRITSVAQAKELLLGIDKTMEQQLVKFFFSGNFSDPHSIA